MVHAEQKLTVDIKNPAKIDLKGADIHQEKIPNGKSETNFIIQG